MRNLDQMTKENTYFLSINELLCIKGGTNDNDPPPPKKDPEDDREFITEDTDFDFWLEPEV
ncbi:MAG: hypothetical protein U9R19_02335 [Bacteroidota bacterium]|nr:hypothetical protein [Bacteroidota bacterium]